MSWLLHVWADCLDLQQFPYGYNTSERSHKSMDELVKLDQRLSKRTQMCDQVMPQSEERKQNNNPAANDFTASASKTVEVTFCSTTVPSIVYFNEIYHKLFTGKQSRLAPAMEQVACDSSSSPRVKSTALEPHDWPLRKVKGGERHARPLTEIRWHMSVLGAALDAE